ncbi:hypothetical protein D9M73_106840 [compost metagenome]
MTWGSATLTFNARIEEIVHSHGVLNFTGCSTHASGEAISARYSVGKSPPEVRKAVCKRSTIAGGGVSPAKCRASLVAICVAVAGAMATSNNTARACSTPPAG